MTTVNAMLVAGFFSTMIVAVADVQKKDVDIKAPDGVNLKGTYFSPGRPGPAVLLLHQCNMDRHAWDALAADFARAGIQVLTFDFRGFGESGGERLTDPAARRAIQQEKWPGDIDAAYAYLLSQKGVDKSRIAAGGASCGVAQSSNLAARHQEIKALVLLSGPASDAGRDYITKTPTLPVFGAASEEDKNAAVGIRAVLEGSKNPQSMLKMYGGTEHGVPMFDKNPELEPMIVNWLKARLLVKKGS
ncbi:MAG: alpha/beta hydrolase [Acidobacteriia bacterium]|nr:alpha/beta hydrolase [Terriglobia bacterium]